MKWFTSDLHFGHRNVINYCNRPFRDANGNPDVHAMNRSLVSNWNSKITEDDEVFFLGDFFMNPREMRYLKMLKFKHLTWVLGNHDKAGKVEKWLNENPDIRAKTFVCFNTSVELDGQRFYLVHRPILASYICPTLCGHVHEKWVFQAAGSTIQEYRHSGDVQQVTLKFPVLNVGADAHGLLPISEKQVLTFFRGESDV